MTSYRTSLFKIQINQFKPIDNMSQTVTDERLQQVVNTFQKTRDEYRTSQIEKIKVSSVERMLRDATARGIMPEEVEETNRPMCWY